MRPSIVREKLSRGNYIVMGQSWIIPHWKVVDIMGHIGFDAVWIEHEHSDFTHGEIAQMILAARAHNMDSLVRIARTGYTGTLKILESGATGIIVPHCMGAADAESIVRDAKYGPAGFRGSGGSTDADYGTVDRQAYFENANRETLIAVIIEDKEAVDEVDEIAATEGIDIILMGPGDLSQSYGVIGQLNHELVVKATDAVAEACARHNKWWGTPVGSRDEAADMLKRGGRIVQCSHEQSILVEGFSKMKAEFEGIKV